MPGSVEFLSIDAVASSPDGLFLAVGDVEFDEIHFVAWPDPGTLGILALGAFAALRRRRV